MSTNLCYSCKHRNTIPGSVHSSCGVIPKELQALACLLAPSTPVNIEFDKQGIDNGWAMWPINFDPIWLKRCNFYESHNIPNPLMADTR